MNWRSQRGKVLNDFETRLENELSELPAKIDRLLRRREVRMRLSNSAAYVAGAVAVLAAGLYAGRELRSRYQFKRRTPYDFYAHSGDRTPDVEFSVGV